MPTLQSAIDAGQLEVALDLVQEALRGDPTTGETRWQFFQLLCINGEWGRALGQLRLLARQDPEFLLKAHGLRQAVQCEAVRTEVLSGRQTPLVFGEPVQWFAQLVQALRAGSQGRYEDAVRLRDAALDSAVPVSVRREGKQEDYMLDADGRFGPVLEAVMEGRYCWIPMERVRRLVFQAPAKLMDVVWSRADVVWTNGGTSVAFIPTRYPGSERDPDPWVRLARVAEWDERAPGLYHGRGVRTFVIGGDYVPIVALRELEFGGGEA